MLTLALLPEPLLWAISLLALGALAFGFYAVINPSPFVKGQDAAGKGMAIGCIMILMGLLCAAIGLFTAATAYLVGGAYSLPTRILAYTPFTLVTTLFAITLLIEKIRQSNRRRQDYLREMAQPLFCTIHAEPDLSKMFAALQQLDPATEQQLWEHPAAFIWQFDRFLPRCRFISIQTGIAHPSNPDQMPDTSERLAQALADERPTCPILLLGPTEEAIAKLTAILSPKWRTRPLLINPATHPDWITTHWLPAIQDLTAIPAVHPESP